MEMAGKHSKFISDIIYIYNTDNPINDHKVNVNLQQSLEHYIRSLPKYQKIEASPIPKYQDLPFVTFTDLGKYGRLGNQLFQLSALISLAYNNGSVINGNWHCNYTNKDMSSFQDF